MPAATPGLSFSSSAYRYGFQGQEKDDEVKGNGNSVNFKYRMHDPRIGRFFAVDPLTKEYPHYTPYSFSGNMVINAIELEGLEQYVIINDYQGGNRVQTTQVTSYQDISGNIINQNLTGPAAGGGRSNYSSIPVLMINVNAPASVLPVERYASLNTAIGNYNNLNGNALYRNTRAANPGGALGNPSPITVQYDPQNTSNPGDDFVSGGFINGPQNSPTQAVNFTYSITRQNGIVVNFTRFSAFTVRNPAAVQNQLQIVADWLNIFVGETITITGNVANMWPNNQPAAYTDERNATIAAAAAGTAAGSPGTNGGLKGARANRLRNWLLGFGGPATRIGTAVGAPSPTAISATIQYTVPPPPTTP